MSASYVFDSSVAQNQSAGHVLYTATSQLLQGHREHSWIRSIVELLQLALEQPLGNYTRLPTRDGRIDWIQTELLLS